MRRTARTLPPTLSLALLALAACERPVSPSARADAGSAAVAVAAEASGRMTRLTFPDQDPGVPVYARATPIGNQLYTDDGWLAIPFYRQPACIPADFDLLSFYHFPGPGGPGAFGCPLLVTGALMIEAGAPLGTFPKIAISRGDAVPVWFVRRAEFDAAAADGMVTMGELAALPSLVRGTATSFEETLRPRAGDHLVVIDAQGRLEDGRRFTLHVTNVEGRPAVVRIAFR
jgi:hypothetical protein